MASYQVTVVETWIIDEEYVNKEDVRNDLLAIIQDTNSVDWEMDYKLAGKP